MSLSKGDIVYYFTEELVEGKFKVRVCAGEVVVVNPTSGKMAVAEVGAITKNLRSFSSSDLNRYFFMNKRDMLYRIP